MYSLKAAMKWDEEVVPDSNLPAVSLVQIR
jgi:hypothetical protein